MKTAQKYYPYSSMSDKAIEALNLVMPSEAFLNAPLRISKELANCKPAIWDVTNTYCDKYCDYRKRDEGALKVLRKIPSGIPSKKQLTVTINGVTNVWTIGKKNEYYLNGKGLTETLETVAKSSNNNKITIQ